jgi:hypothetical protein
MCCHAYWTRSRIEGQEIHVKNPVKMLEKLGCEKYTSKYGNQEKESISLFLPINNTQ